MSTFARRLLGIPSQARFAQTVWCSSDTKRLPVDEAPAARTRVDTPDPHSSTGPDALVNQFNRLSRTTSSALHELPQARTILCRSCCRLASVADTRASRATRRRNCHDRKARNDIDGQG
jgi:hypothetical protein